MEVAMKKLIILLLVFTCLTFADVIYYNSDYKMINCQLVSSEKDKIIVNTITKNGMSKQEIPNSIVKVIGVGEFNMNNLTRVVKKDPEDKDKELVLLTKRKADDKLLAKQKVKTKKNPEAKVLLKKNAKLKQGIRQVKEQDYKITANIHMLCTGVAISTYGISNFSGIKDLNRQISDLADAGDMFQDMIDDLKNERTKAYAYGSIFTLTGLIDIVFSFQKVDVRTSGNQLELSYNF